MSGPASDTDFHGWRVARFAAALAFFAWGIGFYGPAVFLQTLHGQHGWSISTLSGAVSLHFALGATVVLWLPELHRRFGLWRCTATGLALAAAGAVAWSSCTQPWHPYAAACISAPGWALTSGATLNAILSPWFNQQRPRAMALAFNGATTGGLVFAPLWVGLIAVLGFSPAALAVGAVMLLLMQPAAYRWLRHGPAAFGQHPDGQLHPPALATSAPAMPTPRATLLRDRRFLSLSLPFALALFAQVGLLAHLMVRLTPALGEAHAAWAISTVAISGVFGRSLLARLLGEHDRRLAAAGNFGIQALGTLLLITAEGTVPLLAGCMLFGLGFGNLTSLPPLIAQQTFHARDVPTVVAMVTALNQGLFAFGPVVFGLLRDAGDSYRLPFALALAAQALAMVGVLSGRARQSPRR